MKKRRAEEQRLKSARGREKSSDDIFVCERVCTSKRMLKKVGVFSKDLTPDTCATVCGVSELDACADACARTVCVNQHQVPNWNDICLKRSGEIMWRRHETKEKRVKKVETIEKIREEIEEERKREKKGEWETLLRTFEDWRRYGGGAIGETSEMEAQLREVETVARRETWMMEAQLRWR
ncbi:hypothetical protein RJ640_006791 [Escallonia rubra]|uniref:Uncharacterized protein n=1 Tax=Escallonia rubra TaxID=112253 RepID=A0AA88R0H5_9ASTE|nr:hypothetical protein RJ640_006791 [Escallonia rubra]